MKKHINGLDTLRAVAALVVVIGHIELIKSNLGIPNLLNHAFVPLADGHIAVYLFFVLSGFLITYLLIREKEQYGKIGLRDFYMRRILRIWPVYYMVMLISYVLFDAAYSIKSTLLCLFFCPNIAAALDIGWPTSPQIWSIGVEEQFYLFWPLLLGFIPARRVVLFLLLFFFGFSLLPYGIDFLNNQVWQSNVLADFSNGFFYNSKFGCMSIGCLFGYLYAVDHPKLSWFRNRPVAITAVAAAFGLWFMDVRFPHFTDEIFSFLFALLILNVASGKTYEPTIANRISGFLGKISYGIYMYHWIVLLLAVEIFPYRLFAGDATYNVVFYLVVLTGTIGMAWLSYHTLEAYFRKLKRKFER